MKLRAGKVPVSVPPNGAVPLPHWKNHGDFCNLPLKDRNRQRLLNGIVTIKGIIEFFFYFYKWSSWLIGESQLSPEPLYIRQLQWIESHISNNDFHPS